MLIINFTNEFSQLSADQFIDKFIVHGIGASEVVIGYDHHFGKGRGGNIDFLKSKAKQGGFNVTVIPEYKINDIDVNSSQIRKALEDGDIKKANAFLGRFYSFNGSVIEGDKRGRELGFPTANLNIEDDDKMLPAIGIYAVEIVVNRVKHFGLLSVGKRPTFYDQGEIVPEVYIYDFDEEIYDEKVTINVVERIRGEEKFSSAGELIKQMKYDKKIGLEILKNKLTN